MRSVWVHLLVLLCICISLDIVSARKDGSEGQASQPAPSQLSPPPPFKVAQTPRKNVAEPKRVTGKTEDRTNQCVKIFPHAIHGSVSNDLLTRNGTLNFVKHKEYRCDNGAPLEGFPLKGLNRSPQAALLEALAILFAAREPAADRILLGDKIPQLEAVATMPCHSAVMFSAAETKSEEFPVDKFVGYDTPGHTSLTAYSETCSLLAFNGQAYYLVIDHTIAKIGQDDHGNRWEIGVVPTAGDDNIPPFLCQLYMTPYGQNKSPDYRLPEPQPYRIDGKPIQVVFTWPAPNGQIAFSNVCFEQDLFWTTGEVDVNAHDANIQHPTQAPPEDITPNRWPPVFYAPEPANSPADPPVLN